MPWYQLKATPPLASIYHPSPNNQIYQVEEEGGEFEFEAHQQQQPIDSSSSSVCIFKDPLALRIASLLSPPTTTTTTTSSLSSCLIHKNNNSHDNILYNIHKASSYELSTLPHPSFPFQQSSSSLSHNVDTTVHNHLHTIDESYRNYAHFFHPHPWSMIAFQKIDIDSSFSNHSNVHDQSATTTTDMEQCHFNDNIGYSTLYQNNLATTTATTTTTTTMQNPHAGGGNHQTSLENSHYNNNPNHPYGFIYEEEEGESSNMLQSSNKRRKKKRMKQSRLRQDDNIISNVSSPNFHSHEWSQVGQYATYNQLESYPSNRGNANNDQSSSSLREENSRNKKSKKKGKKTKKKNNDSRESMDIRDAIVPKSNENNNHNTSPDNVIGEDSVHNIQNHTQRNTNPKKRTKRGTVDNKSSKNNTQGPTVLHPISYDTMQIFSEQYDVKNAGSSTESISAFLDLIKQQKYISWTIIYHDERCSTPFVSYTQKYCTEKGPVCQKWNCICDNQVRAMQASQPIVGALFVFPMDLATQPNILSTFLLPLGPTTDPDNGPSDIDQGYERMARWPLLVISCETSLQQRWDAFRSILMNRSLTCVTYNAPVGLMPYHYHCLNDISENRIECLDLLIPKVWDLKLASWILSPHSDEKEFEFKEKYIGFSHLIPNNYDPPQNACKQLFGLIRAKQELEFLFVIFPIIERLLDENELKVAFDDIESPLLGILSAMECTGIGFQSDELKQLEDYATSKIDDLHSEARRISNDSTLLLSSPAQLSTLLYDKMKLTIPQNATKNPSKNHLSTSEATLEAIQTAYNSQNGKSIPIIDIILEFRSLNKIVNTFIHPLIKLSRIDKSHHLSRHVRKQKIHPMWIQTAVRTGRLSCRKPNIQQIPNRSVHGVHPRDAFVASSDDCCLFACDYSQMEVRLLAHMSGDEKLVQLFSAEGNIDIYKQMACITTGKNESEVLDTERAVAKQVTLAIMYGMGVDQVAKKLDVDMTTAKAFFTKFYSRFPTVKNWMEDTIDFARKFKYVKTISGRRRYLDHIDSDDYNLKKQAERQAVNTVIQGSAADLMKIAMLKVASRITDWRKERGDSGTRVVPKLLLQIHDELVFEVMKDENDLRLLKSIIIRCCAEECVEELRLKVPLLLKCSVGEAWGSMTEV